MPRCARSLARFRRTGFLGLALLALSTPAAAHATGASTAGWVTDGPVAAAVSDDAGRTYITGTFSLLGPRLGSAIAMTPSNDQPAAGFPDVAGEVLAITGDGAGGWFIGGAFTSVGGVPRSHLAHIRADRTLDPSWNPGTNGTEVRGLARLGTALYVAGSFTNAGGVSTQSVAKLSTGGTGAGDQAFKVPFLTPARSVAVAGGSVYVGGGTSLAAFDALTGGTTWNVPVDGPVLALSAAADGLFAGGTFSSIGGTNRTSVAKLSFSGTPDASWNANINGSDVSALLVVGSDLYLGGGFTAVAGENRDGVARVSAGGTGAVQPWAPTLDPVVTRVFALAVDGDAVYIGGDFFVGSKTHLARASAASGTVDSWAPNPVAPVKAIGATGDGVLVGGAFATAGNAVVPRDSLARLTRDGDLDTTWIPPTIYGQPVAMALSGTSLFLGGAITATLGQQHKVLKFSTATAARDAGWTPTIPRIPTALAATGDTLFVAQESDGVSTDGVLKLAIANPGTPDAAWQPKIVGVKAMAASPSALFVGADLILGGDDGLDRPLVKLPTGGTGAVDAAWDPGVTGSVKALAVAGSEVVVGGDVIGPDALRRLLKASATGTGAVDTAWAPQPDNLVTALAVTGGTLYAGGAFAKVRGLVHTRLARIPLAGDGAPDATFDASADQRVDALAVSADRVVAGGLFTATGSLSTAGVATFDLSAPTVSVTVPADSGRYRAGQAYPAAFGCTDPDGPANVVSCAGTVAAGSAIDTATPGAHAFTVTATDVSGNTATRTVSYVVDASAPTVAFDALPSGGGYGIGEQAVVTYRCTDADGGQDVATCAGPVASGGLLNTSSPGEKSFTVTATDLVGNTSSATVAYTVRPDRAKPVLSALVFSPSAFRAETAGGPIGKTTSKQLKRGSKVSFKVSEAGRVTFTVIAPKQGKVKARTLGSFTVLAKKGTTRFVFRGRIRSKTLKPGSYQVTAQARDTVGLKSALVHKTIKIKR